MGLLLYNIAFVFSFDKIYPEKCEIEGIAKIISIVEEKEYYNKYIVKFLSNKKTKLIIYTDKKENFIPGDIISIKGKFEKAQKARNYGGFNYRNYLKQQKIHGIVYCEKISKIKESFHIQKVRLYIYNKINNLYKDEYSKFLNGILIGKSDELSDNIKENFRDSSISHILAISGLHVSYVVIGLKFILDKIINSKKIKNILIIMFLFFFAFFTGFSSSCIRACIMNVMIFLNSNLHRKNNFYINFLLAFFIIISINPFNIFNVGMWLSFFGTLGIVLFYNFFVRISEIKLKKKYKILNIFFVSFSAQILIFPIMIYVFNTISFTFFISNILVSFIIGPILVIGYISIIFSIFLNPIAKLLSKLENLLIYIIFKIAEICSKIPFSKIYVITPKIIFIILFYIIIFYLIYLFKTRFFYMMKLVFFKKKIVIKNFSKMWKYIFCLFIFSLLFNFNKGLLINFIDVGQGDSCLITTPLGKNILIDGGEYDYGENVLLPYLLDKQIVKIDYLIISHCDSDHIGGLFSVLKNIKVEKVFIGIQSKYSEQLQDLLKIVNNKNIELITLEEGNSVKIEKSVNLQVLWPNRNEIINENSLNNNSLVFKIIYNNFSILFTGDIEEIAENKIVEIQKKELNSIILKVAHHGSKTSSTEKFIENVKPQIAIIGVGEKNKFGHPSDIIIERLESKKCKIYRTDINGEIEFNIDKKGKVRTNCKY